MELALTICAVIILLQGAAIIFITKSKKLNPNERAYLIEVVAQRDRLEAMRLHIISICEEGEKMSAKFDRERAESDAKWKAINDNKMAEWKAENEKKKAERVAAKVNKILPTN